jgi:hypothetical protein
MPRPNRFTILEELRHGSADDDTVVDRVKRSARERDEEMDRRVRVIGARERARRFTRDFSVRVRRIDEPEARS